MTLREQQCVLHPRRGAVARCPLCNCFYCHECITEHDGKVLCRRCLHQQTADTDKEISFLDRYGAIVSLFFKSFLAMIGLLLLWLIFITIGSMLIRLPNSFYLSTPDLSGERALR